MSLLSNYLSEKKQDVCGHDITYGILLKKKFSCYNYHGMRVKQLGINTRSDVEKLWTSRRSEPNWAKFSDITGINSYIFVRATSHDKLLITSMTKLHLPTYH